MSVKRIQILSRIEIDKMESCQRYFANRTMQVICYMGYEVGLHYQYLARDETIEVMQHMETVIENTEIDEMNPLNQKAMAISP